MMSFEDKIYMDIVVFDENYNFVVHNIFVCLVSWRLHQYKLYVIISGLI
jgi:hypothetical protein